MYKIVNPLNIFFITGKFLANMARRSWVWRGGGWRGWWIKRFNVLGKIWNWKTNWTKQQLCSREKFQNSFLFQLMKPSTFMFELCLFLCQSWVWVSIMKCARNKMNDFPWWLACQIDLEHTTSYGSFLLWKFLSRCVLCLLFWAKDLAARRVGCVQKARSQVAKKSHFPNKFFFIWKLEMYQIKLIRANLPSGQ